MKHLKACAVVGSALLISLALLSLPTSPRTYFVLASPSNNNDYGESCIESVIIFFDVLPSGITPAVGFTSTGEIEYTALGKVINTVQVVVYLDNTYAATEANAITYTRVHMLLKNPNEETVYDNVLPNMSGSGKLTTDNCWYVCYLTDLIDETLVAGKYTITTTYEILIEP